MEFLPMRRFREISNPFFPSFSELRKMKPVTMTMDLELVDEPDNVSYLNELASRQLELFPVRRVMAGAPMFHRADFPNRVLFEMTSICNTICLMCPQVNLKRKPVHMDKDKYKSIIDELDGYGLDGLWLYHFGESLAHPDFKEIIEYIRNKKNLGYVWLSTNGILMDREITDLLFSSSLSYINFSLQSISLDNYKKIAPRSPAQKIFENLDYLIGMKKANLGRKPFFRLQIIEQHNTLQEIDVYLRRFYDKCDLISVNMLEHTDIAYNKPSKGLREHKEKNRCARLNRSDCFINSDGTVTICDNAYNNELDIGNVWSNSVHDIWNGSERRRILDMNEHGTLWDIPLCCECTDYDL